MACSICGKEGHVSKACPQLPTSQTESGDDYAVWARFGGMTKDQAKELRRKIEDAADVVAPESYGLTAAGKASKLPERIQQAIQSFREKKFLGNK